MPSFTSLGLFLLGAGAALANTVTFKSLDQTSRTIKFTPNAGVPEIPSIQVAGGQEVTVDFPHAWIGNWYSISEGEQDIPGMLGEVAFNGWNDITFFDVSAIVNPNDHNGVKKMYPVNDPSPISGCDIFPCNNAYYLWDDVQTKATQEKDIVCTLGSGSVNTREAVADVVLDEPVFKRDFVMGKWTR
ncbi:DNase1 protein [Coniochaeta sp. 2T2.1]|nr:DNase1 protein [Coniochaeta sp. 2T2.1]